MLETPPHAGHRVWVGYFGYNALILAKMAHEKLFTIVFTHLSQRRLKQLLSEVLLIHLGGMPDWLGREYSRSLDQREMLYSVRLFYKLVL